MVRIKERLRDNVVDFTALSGVAENAEDLGIFTGAIISNNQSIKVALQELETALGGVGGDNLGNHLVTQDLNLPV